MTITYKQDQIEGNIEDIEPIQIRMVRQTPYEPLWNELVREHHYLGYRKMPGANLKYLVFHGSTPLAAMSFRAASLKLASRDHFIGWSAEQKTQHLSQLANNNRFLILPWVKVKNLGSYLLAKIIPQLIRDWHSKYAKQLLLLETFVDSRYFQGTIYKASGWIHVGSTAGYTPRGKSYQYHGYPKEVYLYPLRGYFRSIIGCIKRPEPSTSVVERSLDTMLLERIGWNPNIAAELSIAPEDVSTLTQKLVTYVNKFKDCFRSKVQLSHAMAYLKGLASDLQAKSVEPIAINILGETRVRALQHFITGAPWDSEKILAKSREEILNDIAEDNGMVTFDSSEMPKKGKHSAGVMRQYCGNQGKIENCQSGVFIGYTSDRGYTLLDAKLYVPEKWFDDDYKALREETNVPAELEFQTKLDIALELLAKTEQSTTFCCRWVGMDCFFGRDTAFRDKVGEQYYYYFADIPVDTKVWLEQPQIGIPPYKGRGKRPTKERAFTDAIQVRELAQDPSLPWEMVNLGEGAKGPILAEVVCMRVIECRDNMPAKELWLFLRKNTDGQIKYAFSNAPADIPMEELLRASSMRWSIEQLFQEGKGYLGMDSYEVRSYLGWHRHMALVILLMHFLLMVRREFSEKKTI